MYLTGEGSDDVRFNIGGLDSPMEVGGPMMGLSRHTSVLGSVHGREEKDIRMVNEKQAGQAHPNHVASLPSSDQTMTSGLGRELTAAKYTTRKGTASTIEGQSVEGV